MANSTSTIKPGYKTSEFYVTLISSLAGLLMVAGIFTSDQANVFEEALQSIVGGLMTLIPVVEYIRSRIEAKLK
jgi:hypothetical protein